jgi:hypothetical protein
VKRRDNRDKRGIPDDVIANDRNDELWRLRSSQNVLFMSEDHAMFYQGISVIRLCDFEQEFLRSNESELRKSWQGVTV